MCSRCGWKELLGMSIVQDRWNSENNQGEAITYMRVREEGSDGGAHERSHLQSSLAPH